MTKIPACLALLALLGGALGAGAGTPSGDAAAGEAAPVPGAVEYHYRWHLASFLGWLAGLFLPNHGDGVLTFTPGADGHLRTELLITSEESRDGEYWRYGSEVDLASGRALEAWSSYFFRGKQREKRQAIGEEGVFDVASAIYQLRIDPPSKPRPLDIWSDGKTYPVVVIPLGEETRTVGGRRVETRHFSVRGIRTHDRERWKGRLELWIARDEAATPVVIRVERSGAAVHLELTG
jgi:Protein of unknown function (DUF3108)